MKNFVPELNVTIAHPDWYSLTLLKRVELSGSQIETLLKNEVSTRNRQNVLRYFRAHLTPRALDAAYTCACEDTTTKDTLCPTCHTRATPRQ